MNFLNKILSLVFCGLAFFAPCEGRSRITRMKSNTERTVVRRGKKGSFVKQLGTFGKRVGIFAGTVVGTVAGLYVGMGALIVTAVFVPSLMFAKGWLAFTSIMTFGYGGMLGGGYAGNKLTRRIVGRNKPVNTATVQVVQVAENK